MSAIEMKGMLSKMKRMHLVRAIRTAWSEFAMVMEAQSKCGMASGCMSFFLGDVKRFPMEFDADNRGLDFANYE